MHKSRFKPKPIGIIMLLLSLAIIAGSILTYRFLLEKDLSAAGCETLDNVLCQQQLAVSSTLLGQKEAVTTYATLLCDNTENDESILKTLEAIAQKSSFDFVSYVDINGDTIENTGTRLNVADRDYFKRAILGEVVIAEPVVSKVSHSDIITFSAPITTNGKISGILVGIYDTANLSSLLSPTFSGSGYAYVTSSNGVVILKTQTNSVLSLYSNLFNALSDIKVSEHDSFDTMMSNISIGESGHSNFMLNGERRMLHYMPAGINDWYIFSVVSQDAISTQASEIMKNTTALAAALTVLYIFLMIYFVCEEKKHINEISKIAFVDTLTGKANRKKFRIEAAELIKNHSVNYAFVIMDIDKFKVLNDTLGYESGNQTLICISNAIEENIFSDEFFCRCDSDEYYMLLKFDNNESLEARIKQIIAHCKGLFAKNINSFYNLLICAGVYVITDPGEAISGFIDRAKHAQHLIKGSQISTVSFYNEDMRRHLLREKQIENTMHMALENDDFKLYLQPKYLLNREKICGAEALVRWQNADGPIMFPDEFIPLFEKNGFVIKLDFFMLESACKCIKNWIDSGISPVPISVNFSRLHLADDHFVDELAKTVKKYGISPKLIEIELTESTVLNNEKALIDVLAKLHEFGFSLSIDDFGSGYSSLGLLKNLPVDIIKLDRTFFAQYSDLKRAKIVIFSMISMAKQLGIYTVAEGVETKENIDLLSELGCDIVQGFYYARPMPEEELLPILKEGCADAISLHTSLRIS